MNFILRHLGWFLLGGFFLFMFFLVSQNDVTPKQKNLSGSLIESITGTTHTESKKMTITRHTDEKGDDKKIENIVKDELGSKDASGSLKKEDATNEKMDNSPSFFEKLFGKNSSPDEEKTVSSGSSLLTESTSPEVQKPSAPVRNMNDYTVIGVKNGNSSHLQKNSLTNTSVSNYQKSEIVIPKKYPKTPVGTEFSIATYSLKLNDATFSNTLAYMLEGDTIKQIGNENSLGCFEGEIISAAKKQLIGKRGYVCKKYLTSSVKNNSSEIVSELPPVTIPEKEVVLPPSIGDYGQKITLAQAYMLDMQYPLVSGDVVEFLGNNGSCAVVYVHETLDSSSVAKGRSGKICN